MILIEVEGFEVAGLEAVTADELDRALEVAQNWGGWSFEEAQLVARALLTLNEGGGLVRVAAPEPPPEPAL